MTNSHSHFVSKDKSDTTKEYVPPVIPFGCPEEKKYQKNQVDHYRKSKLTITLYLVMVQRWSHASCLEDFSDGRGGGEMWKECIEGGNWGCLKDINQGRGQVSKVLLMSRFVLLLLFDLAQASNGSPEEPDNMVNIFTLNTCDLEGFNSLFKLGNCLSCCWQQLINHDDEEEATAFSFKRIVIVGFKSLGPKFCWGVILHKIQRQGEIVVVPSVRCPGMVPFIACSDFFNGHGL